MITLRPVETRHGNREGLPDTFLVRRLVPDRLERDLALHRPAYAMPYWLALLVSGAIGLAGAVAIVLNALTGSGYARWGYTAAGAVFVLSTAQAAPLLAFASRLGRGWWGMPLRRVTEAGALGGLVSAPALILLLFQLPDWHGRPSIWQGWAGAPQLWDTIAILTLTCLGLALLYLDCIPDLPSLSTLRRRTKDERRNNRPFPSFVFRPSSWAGAERQWGVLWKGQVLLGGLYLMAYAFVHFLVISDLALSLVPKWKSANMPPYQVVTSIEGGVAFTIVALWAARRWAGVERHVDHAPFHAAANILLALAPLWFYFFWSEFLTYWYARTPDEQRLIQLLMTGPALGPFLATFALCFVVPFALLLWNPLRKRPGIVALAAALVLLGNLLDRVRLFVSAWSVAEDQIRSHLDVLPPWCFPGVLDLAAVAGFMAAVVVLLLLAVRYIPAVSVWELKAMHLLKRTHEYVKTNVPLIAKPS